MDEATFRSKVVQAFQEQYLQDRRAEGAQSLSEYLRLFKGDDAGVAEAYLALEKSTDTPVSGQVPEVRPGVQSIGNCRIVKEIGRGGQGIVYLAEDERLGRKLALKVLTGFAAASDGSLKRFQREAEMASRLHHPGICTVYQAGVDSGIPYIAMQYVEGQSLAHKIAGAREAPGRAESTIIDLQELENEDELDESPEVEPSPTPSRPVTRSELMRVVEMIEKVARALHTAHEAGVIHRDIKPGNIVINPRGEPVILDFGLARELEGEAQTLTRTGEVFGTPAYMAPEQIANQGDRPDRRTDLYSLGVVLYECLTLTRPFEATSHQALFQAILTKAPPDPRRLNSSIPQDLKVVLETALEKNRGRRYKTALEFAEDLRRVRTFEPVSARPIGTIGRLVRTARRNPVAAASVSVAALILMGGVAWGAYLMGVAEEERQQKERIEGERNEAITDLQQAEEERDRLREMMDALSSQNKTIIPQQEPALEPRVGEMAG